MKHKKITIMVVLMAITAISTLDNALAASYEYFESNPTVLNGTHISGNYQLLRNNDGNEMTWYSDGGFFAKTKLKFTTQGYQYSNIYIDIRSTRNTIKELTVEFWDGPTKTYRIYEGENYLHLDSSDYMRYCIRSITIYTWSFSIYTRYYLHIDYFFLYRPYV